MKSYVADFETTTIETCDSETWVWSYGALQLFPESEKEKEMIKGTNIDDFMNWCSYSSKEIYFHNLKFDGMFILDWLLNNSFEYNEEKKAKERTFKVVITKDGIFYQIEVYWKVRSKRIVKTTFKDSYKKLPFTVKRIAQAFKLEMGKGDIDYNAVRPRGYEPTPEEWDYLYKDVEIMRQALEIQIGENLTKMTIGSDSLNTFKTLLAKSENGQIKERKFRDVFPLLEKDLNDDIRRSYKGGFTYLNPIHAGVDIKQGQVYDVNSLYPAVMYYKDMPYGDPIRFEGKYEPSKRYPLYIQALKCEFFLKKGYIPTIQIKGDYRFKATEYLTSSNGYHVELLLTNVDLELFFEHYDVIVHEWQYYYQFKSVNGIFNEYIDKYMSIKKVETGAKRELAKLLLNNLYGKFASSTDATGKIPELNEKTGLLKLKVDENPKEKDSIYTPVGAFITAYAREITIRGAQALGGRFIYADTDSLHIRGLEPVDLDIHATDLGKWKFEGEFLRGRFLRAKTYMEEIAQNDKGDCKISEMTHTKVKVVCAGMNDKIKQQITFDNFKKGNSFYGKLIPKIIKGGVVLKDDYFTLKL